MVELLAAMTILAVGIMSVYALFQSGLMQIRRASTITTAAALADAEMEKYRAIKYESLGLDNADVAAAAADATHGSSYTSDPAYRADTSPSTTLAASIAADATTITVASASGFPTVAPYLVKIDDELIIVNSGVGTTTWVVKRAQMGTTAASHAAAAAVTQKQRAHVVRCGTQPCTEILPTKTVPGADGKNYLVYTYATWRTISNSASPSQSGRLLKLVTVAVRDTAAPYRTWARISSAFDESTGL